MQKKISLQPNNKIVYKNPKNFFSKLRSFIIRKKLEVVN